MKTHTKCLECRIYSAVKWIRVYCARTKRTYVFHALWVLNNFCCQGCREHRKYANSSSCTVKMDSNIRQLLAATQQFGGKLWVLSILCMVWCTITLEGVDLSLLFDVVRTATISSIWDWVSSKLIAAWAWGWGGCWWVSSVGGGDGDVYYIIPDWLNSYWFWNRSSSSPWLDLDYIIRLGVYYFNIIIKKS